MSGIALEDRLQFELPDFTRWSWVSDRAREVWWPRLRRIANAWTAIEWISVEEGVRPACLISAAPADLIERTPQWLQGGLASLPLAMEAIPRHTYSSSSAPHRSGEPFRFRVAVGRTEAVRNLADAWRSGDAQRIGEPLGYPTCCQRFFHKVWVEADMFDTTFPMAASGRRSGLRQLDCAGLLHANVLWRWMSARAVPHLPCSFDCEPSASLGEQMVEVGRRRGFSEEMGWLLEILDWPVQWTALHGIAEIKTPILKISTRTDATSTMYTVRRHGGGYPAEGAVGLAFPFRSAGLPLQSSSASAQRGLENPIQLWVPGGAAEAAENGFSSATAMERAHRPILARLRKLVQAGPVIDLGCGTGRLLRELHGAVAAVRPHGVDRNPALIERAQRLMPAFAANFRTGNLFLPEVTLPRDVHFAAGLLMLARLEEASRPAAEGLLARLFGQIDKLLVYSYSDRVATRAAFERLAQQLGLHLDGLDESPGVILAEARIR